MDPKPPASWLWFALHGCRLTRMMVVAGEYSLTIYEGTEQGILPQLLVPHPEYNITTNNNDIMLIKVHKNVAGLAPLCLNLLSSISVYWSRCPPPPQLKAPVYLNSYVSVALLPRQGASIAEGRVCRVSGWGYTNPSGGQIPSTLRTVKLPIVSTEKCNSSESFDGSITENMLCAGYSAGGKDACKVRRVFSGCVRVWAASEYKLCLLSLSVASKSWYICLCRKGNLVINLHFLFQLVMFKC